MWKILKFYNLQNSKNFNLQISKKNPIWNISKISSLENFLKLILQNLKKF